MKVLLDTNVICEPTAATPDAGVLAWLAARDPRDLYISAVSLAEIEEGIARLPANRRRRLLVAWRDALIDALEDRLVPVDAATASAWGALRARLAAEKRTISPMDAFIAATAERHGLTLATRNEKHFTAWGGPLINPWRD